MAVRAARLVSPARPSAVRAPWTAMPEHVRDWVADELGSPVVEAADQVGGMSPGCATRLVCEPTARRAFVKAVGTELNPKTPVLFRREVTALSLLGSHELWADLRASYDDGDWVAILLEDVEGTHPDLDDDATMDILLRETDGWARCWPSGCPTRRHPTRTTAGSADLRREASTSGPTRVARAGEIPADLLPDWVRHDTATWEPLVRALADHERPARALGHPQRQPPRAPHRRAGLPRLGRVGGRPAWLDPLLARLERVEQPWFDDALASSPALVAAGDTRGGRLAGRASRRSSPGARTRPSTSTCPPSTISGSASRGACWSGPNGAWASLDLA